MPLSTTNKLVWKLIYTETINTLRQAQQALKDSCQTTPLNTQSMMQADLLLRQVAGVLTVAESYVAALLLEECSAHLMATVSCSDKSQQIRAIRLNYATIHRLILYLSLVANGKFVHANLLTNLVNSSRSEQGKQPIAKKFLQRPNLDSVVYLCADKARAQKASSKHCETFWSKCHQQFKRFCAHLSQNKTESAALPSLLQLLNEVDKRCQHPQGVIWWCARLLVEMKQVLDQPFTPNALAFLQALDTQFVPLVSGELAQPLFKRSLLQGVDCLLADKCYSEDINQVVIITKNLTLPLQLRQSKLARDDTHRFVLQQLQLIEQTVIAYVDSTHPHCFDMPRLVERMRSTVELLSKLELVVEQMVLLEQEQRLTQMLASQTQEPVLLANLAKSIRHLAKQVSRNNLVSTS